nr:hypothetical protein Iba_scaffold2019CG0020 [Ipomoea batatas]GME10300.1 hypothetical protein Iba_scaffold9892CG0010 [Ipomoea batatas]
MHNAASSRCSLSLPRRRRVEEREKTAAIACRRLPMPLAFFTAQAHGCCRGTSSITTRCRRRLRKEREEGSGLEKRMVTLESIVEAANTSIVIGDAQRCFLSLQFIVASSPESRGEGEDRCYCLPEIADASCVLHRSNSRLLSRNVVDYNPLPPSIKKGEGRRWWFGEEDGDTGVHC